MNVLVTGATGDVGGYVTTRLLADGAAVRVLCRSVSDRLPREVEVALGDLTAPQTLEHAVAGMDAVVHCAAHLGGGGRALHAQINAAGTRALLAAAQRAGMGRLVHLSTVAVYGRKDDGQVVRPADGYDPFPELRDDYAWSKIEAERWVHLYRRRGLDAVVLRPGIVYGGRRDFVARVARRAAGSLLIVLGSPGMLLPLVHVRDVAEAVVRALHIHSTPAGPLDLVGPSMPTQAEYLLARRSAARGEHLVPIYVPAARLLRRIAAFPGPRKARALAHRLAWATQSVRYENEPLAQALGWCAGVELAQGLADPLGPDPVAAPGVLTMATAPTVRP
jgi:nucleoside-diphosphate-sugar epimerase